MVALIRGWLRRVRKRHRARRRRFTRPHDEWSIGILTGSSPLDLSSPSGLANPVLTARDVRRGASALVADPFLMRRNGRWYLFFESHNRRRDRGEIVVAESADGFGWKVRGVVLREPFHLSFPCVFPWQDEVYMVPESYEAGEVRLYRAQRFPDRWEHVETLLEGEALVDPSVFRHGGRWWMFVETNPEPRRWDTLRLFGSDRLEGRWTEHPSSPVVVAAHAARPAGRVVESDGRLLRFAQVCDPDYGTAVRAYEILELSSTGYAEREVSTRPVLGPGAEPWRATGMHHVDAHRLPDGSWIAAVDGCGRRASGVERVAPAATGNDREAGR